METYRNPLTAAVDIGSAALTGYPLYTAGKAAVAGTQGLADYMLAKKGFDPNLLYNPNRIDDDITVIIQSCDKYKDIWEGWYLSWKKTRSWRIQLPDRCGTAGTGQYCL